MYYYHSTKTENVQSILENGGLELSKSKDGYIYLAEDAATAACFQFLAGVKEFSIIVIDISDNTFDIKVSDDHNEEFFKKLYPKFKKCFYCEGNITIDHFDDIYDYIDGQLVQRDEW